jgi:hypothetical protein
VDGVPVLHGQPRELPDPLDCNRCAFVMVHGLNLA